MGGCHGDAGGSVLPRRAGAVPLFMLGRGGWWCGGKVPPPRPPRPGPASGPAVRWVPPLAAGLAVRRWLARIRPARARGAGQPSGSLVWDSEPCLSRRAPRRPGLSVNAQIEEVVSGVLAGADAAGGRRVRRRGRVGGTHRPQRAADARREWAAPGRGGPAPARWSAVGGHAAGAGARRGYAHVPHRSGWSAVAQFEKGCCPERPLARPSRKTGDLPDTPAALGLPWCALDAHAVAVPRPSA